jgi:hypothetical protein
MDVDVHLVCGDSGTRMPLYPCVDSGCHCAGVLFAYETSVRMVLTSRVMPTQVMVGPVQLRGFARNDNGVWALDVSPKTFYRNVGVHTIVVNERIIGPVIHVQRIMSLWSLVLPVRGVVPPVWNVDVCVRPAANNVAVVRFRSTADRGAFRKAVGPDICVPVECLDDALNSGDDFWRHVRVPCMTTEVVLPVHDPGSVLVQDFVCSILTDAPADDFLMSPNLLPESNEHFISV